MHKYFRSLVTGIALAAASLGITPSVEASPKTLEARVECTNPLVKIAHAAENATSALTGAAASTASWTDETSRELGGDLRGKIVEYGPGAEAATQEIARSGGRTLLNIGSFLGNSALGVLNYGIDGACNVTSVGFNAFVGGISATANGLRDAYHDFKNGSPTIRAPAPDYSSAARGVQEALSRHPEIQESNLRGGYGLAAGSVVTPVTPSAETPSNPAPKTPKPQLPPQKPKSSRPNCKADSAKSFDEVGAAWKAVGDEYNTLKENIQTTSLDVFTAEMSQIEKQARSVQQDLATGAEAFPEGSECRDAYQERADSLLEKINRVYDLKEDNPQAQFDALRANVQLSNASADKLSAQWRQLDAANQALNTLPASQKAAAAAKVAQKADAILQQAEDGANTLPHATPLQQRYEHAKLTMLDKLDRGFIRR